MEEQSSTMNAATRPPQSVVALIPAFEPDQQLVDIVHRLGGHGFTAIIVVDDGSGPSCRPLFDQLERLPDVHVLRHAVNLGKGAALKTGLNHALWRFPECIGVVTADADGQHDPEDIRRIADALAGQDGRLVLGARGFEGVTPWRSRLGNTMTRAAFHLLYGQKLRDTQTGLRGIPRDFIPVLLRLPSSGYDFELDMLVVARHSGVRLKQLPIRTIYQEGNPTTHFHPIRDSWRVYRVLFRYLAFALLTTLVDAGLFMSVFAWTGVALLAQCIARLAALMLNYRLNRPVVTLLTEGHERVWPRYLIGVGLGGAASYALLIVLHKILGFPIVVAKLAAEVSLFMVNFSLMRDCVFTLQKPRALSPGWWGKR